MVKDMPAHGGIVVLREERCVCRTTAQPHHHTRRRCGGADTGGRGVSAALAGVHRAKLDVVKHLGVFGGVVRKSTNRHSLIPIRQRPRGAFLVVHRNGPSAPRCNGKKVRPKPTATPRTNTRAAMLHGKTLAGSAAIGTGK
jgi:hypothetical protein